MMPIASLALVLRLAAGGLAGLCLGFVYFELLRLNTSLLVTGRLAAALALQATRFVLLAAVLAALAWTGPALLIAAALGLPVGRALAMKRTGGAR